MQQLCHVDNLYGAFLLLLVISTDPVLSSALWISTSFFLCFTQEIESYSFGRTYNFTFGAYLFKKVICLFLTRFMVTVSLLTTLKSLKWLHEYNCITQNVLKLVYKNVFLLFFGGRAYKINAQISCGFVHAKFWSSQTVHSIPTSSRDFLNYVLYGFNQVIQLRPISYLQL